MKCTGCGAPFDPSMSVTCMECGHDHSEELSVAEDKMVASASIPNLGAMLKRGKKKGFIAPHQDYQQSKTV